jgi:hypothetical protein
MAQIATIKQHPPTAASTTPKELAGGSSAASLRRFADLPARTASDMIQAGGALARFWIEQANQQAARNAQTLSKLPGGL